MRTSIDLLNGILKALPKAGLAICILLAIFCFIAGFWHHHAFGISAAFALLAWIISPAIEESENASRI